MPEASEAPLRTRDPYLDNVKGLLIVLVVIGHTLGQTLFSYHPSRYAYAWIYLFHMPAFAFVCGLLTRPRQPFKDRTRGVLLSLLLPYVVFQVLYGVLWWLNDDHVERSVEQLLTPLYQLWFLMALAIWRLLTPVLARLPFAVLVTSAVAVVAGATSLTTGLLALNRTLVFLPFFTLGLLHGRQLVDAARRPWAAAVALAGLVVSVPFAAFLVQRHGGTPWPQAFDALGVTFLGGVKTRGALLVVALLLTLAVLVVVPRGTLPGLTLIGRWSLYPFLLHGFVVRQFGYSSLAATTALEVALLVLAAIGLTALLASPPCRALTRRLVEPVRQGRVAVPARATPAFPTSR